MAIIYEDKLKSNLKTGNLAQVYIILGNDGYLKKMYVEKISKLVADKDDFFNYSRYNSNCELQEVYDSACQMPMMADKKCVILCDYDFEHASKTDLERLYKLVEESSDTTVLILWFDALEIDIKKSSKLKKLIASAEKNGGVAVELNHRTVSDLSKMLSDGANKRGSKMSTASARYLIETAGEDINTLVNELEKLCSYAKNTEIDEKLIDYVCAKTPEASVYNLSKQIFASKTGDALKTLDDLFFMRLEPMVILYTISSSYVDMYRLLACKNNMSKKEIADTFGYKGREFVLDRAEQNLRGFDAKKLNLSFEALIDADRQLKSFGGNERTILEQLIVRLIYIIAKGEAVD